MLVTLDSSVFVASIREKEEMHKECKALLDMIVEGKLVAIEPYSVLVEVVAATKRRTVSSEFAEEIGKNLEEISAIHFFELIRRRAEEAASIAARIGVKGMDALVIQIAREMGSFLVSLDEDMMKKAKEEVEGKSVEELINSVR